MSVIDPQVVPLHGWRIFAPVNRALLRRQFRKFLDESATNVLWTFSPLTYNVEALFDKIVYHDVDLLHELPAVNKKMLLEAEAALLDNAHVCIASSSFIAKDLAGKTSTEVLLWENVADSQTFSLGQNVNRIDRAIFAGNMTATKVDFQLIRSVAESGCHVILAGPVAIDGSGSSSEFELLVGHPNIQYVGNLSPSDLAAEMSQSKVGIIPYKIDAHTSGIFPLKVYEYLLAGLYVVSTPLPSLVDRPIEGLETVEGLSDYALRVNAAIKAFDEVNAIHRNQSVQRNTWQNRAIQAQTLIKDFTPHSGAGAADAAIL
ncbi:hypothetical protein CH282_22200 [Rhodococcus sp. 06-418-1B]|nr:glycosyltransferase [Rhodococcus sp. 06-418-1B]OZC78478.1 hypothetical protein CH282_22200 [Rhodococcus sp. 06-418-1B]